MLNNTRSILNCFRTLENSLLECSKIATIQQKRTTFILKRKFPISLHKKSKTALEEKLKNRHFIYDVVKSPHGDRLEPIDIILTDYVEGVGKKGERKVVDHKIAYKKLLLPGLAIYASPENIAKYQLQTSVKDGQFSSIFVERTVKFLSILTIKVEMNFMNPWTLEKWHVKTALRRAGIICPEEAITLPERKISGPDLEIQNKEFYVTLTINNQENVKVRCRIHHVSKNALQCAPLHPEFFKYPTTAIFPEDQEILDSMPKNKFIKLEEDKKQETLL